MAKYKKGNAAKYADSAIDNEVESHHFTADYNEEASSIANSIFNLNGKPFSAVHPTILPKYYMEPQELFDEFGFKLTDGNNTDNLPELEASQHRMKWLAHIQFSTEQMENDLKWKSVNSEKLKGDKLNELLRSNGIPHSLRPFLWIRFSGGYKKKKESPVPYSAISARCERESSISIEGQIDKDLLRTLPTNLCYSNNDMPGISALRRVLKAVAFMYPDIGYCQGMGVVAAILMLVCGEESTFWIMCSLIEDILPPNFYSHNLLGLQADERVIKHLMCIHTPELVELIKTNEIDMSMITINWLLTLFANVLPIQMVLRIWDYIFIDGSVINFRIIISMLKMREQNIFLASKVADNCPAELFNSIVQIPSTISNIDGLIDFMLTYNETITLELISGLRKKYQGKLMVDSGMIFENGDENLPKQKIIKRRLSYSKSFFPNFLSTTPDENIDDPKTKNIRQTEMIVDLRNAIRQVCRHFSMCPENHENVINMQADYSVESHDKDLEQFFKCRSEGRKRAKALLDFQRQEEDELGFEKNEIINIISDKDEHCWIGEVNGRRGWFPAKFVSVIDERGKNYCSYGDEAIEPRVGDVVRRQFAQAFCRIIHHGIRETNIILSTFIGHPWLYIEALTQFLSETKAKTVNSKLTLCDAFKLDQDGKILSPEELLVRAVQEINQIYVVDTTQLDIKLTALICYGLNEQCLHIWFEILCDSNRFQSIREKYYHPYAFVRSPAWKQIKCELRILTQLFFNLLVDSEVTDKSLTSNMTNFVSGNNTKIMKKSGSLDLSLNKQPLREGVRDMLIKHHLFSWDL
uniref:RUN and TBC1 domain-containing protein 3 n=1 Tax=Panagrolaimus sp. JU765 TaxID=591449 RepID=A0AC34QSP7_9BILA